MLAWAKEKIAKLPRNDDLRRAWNKWKNNETTFEPVIDMLLDDHYHSVCTFYNTNMTWAGNSKKYGFYVTEQKMVWQLGCMFLEFGFLDILSAIGTLQQRAFIHERDLRDLVMRLRKENIPEYIVKALSGKISTVAAFVFEGRKFLKDTAPFLDSSVLNVCDITSPIDLAQVQVNGNQVTYQGRIMNRGKMLGKGSMGAVYLYIDEQTKASCAIKYVAPNDPEIEILKLLETNEGCNVIRSRLVAVTPETGVIAMETMGGDLRVFEKKLSVEKVAYIVNECADAFLCLISKTNLYYFDIKCMNALYKCTGKDFTVKVADLGSLFPKGASGVTTFLCPYIERKDATVCIIEDSPVPIVVFPVEEDVNMTGVPVRTMQLPIEDQQVVSVNVYGSLGNSTYLLRRIQGNDWMAIDLNNKSMDQRKDANMMQSQIIYLYNMYVNNK